MNAPAVTRPPKVTTACLFVGVTCLIVLFEVLALLSNWGSIEVQDQIRKALSSEPYKSAGLDVTDVMSWLRWALIAGAAVYAAGIVFAIYAARGHQPSRVILTVIACFSALMFLAGGLLGLLPAAFSIGCAIYLWTPEAQQWFGIKNGKIAPPELAPRPDPFAVPVPPPMVDAGLLAPAYAAPTTVAPAARPARPRPVLVAALITIIAPWIAVAFSALYLIVYATSRDELVRMDTTSPAAKWLGGSTEAEIVDALHGTALMLGYVVVPLSVLAIALGFALLRGLRFARLATIVLAFASIPVALWMVVGLPWAAAAIVVVIQLLKAESRAWFESRTGT